MRVTCIFRDQGRYALVLDRDLHAALTPVITKGESKLMVLRLLKPSSFLASSSLAACTCLTL